MLTERQTNKTEMIAKFARHVSSGKADFFARAGIDFVTGDRDGIYISDLDGGRLINCHCNGGVFNLGHRNPRILAAMERALSKYDIGNHHLMSAPRAALAERLAAISPGDINRVVFGVSGGEAIDLAIKLARGCTGRPQIGRSAFGTSRVNGRIRVPKPAARTKALVGACFTVHQLIRIPAA